MKLPDAAYDLPAPVGDTVHIVDNEQQTCGLFRLRFRQNTAGKQAGDILHDLILQILYRMEQFIKAVR